MKQTNSNSPLPGAPMGSGWLGLALAALLASAAHAQAPTWQMAFSGNNLQPTGGTSQARATAADANGDVLVAGSFTGQVAFGSTLLSSAGGTDAFVAKWNASAETWDWAVRGGGTGADVAYGVAVAGTSVYVAGSFTSATAASFAGTTLSGAGNTDAFLCKLTDAGSTARNGWAVSGGGTGADAAYGVAGSARRVAMVGTFASGTSAGFAGVALAGAGSTDAFVASYEDNGPTATNGWAVSGGGTGDDQGYAVAARDSAVYITGYFNNNSARFAGTAVTGPGLRDVYVAKYLDRSTRAGNGWVATGGARAYDEGRGLAVSGSSVYLTGYLQSAGFGNPGTIAGTTLTSTAGQEDMFVAKYTDNGATATGNWATQGGGGGVDSGYGVAVRGTEVYVAGSFATNNSSGGGTNVITIAGTSLSGTGGQEVFVANFHDNGGTVSNGWASAGGGSTASFTGVPDTGNDYGYGVAATSTGVYAAIASGTGAGRYGSRYGSPAPINGALLAPLSPATGTWQRLEWPLQGTTSRTLATAVDAAGNVFVAGSFSGTVGFGRTQLASVGGTDLFVAKWDAARAAWAWATSGGGPRDDAANGVAVANGNVYVVGSFAAANYQQVSIADTLLTGNLNKEIFVAKFYDQGSTFGNGWCAHGYSSADDEATGVAVVGSNVYVGGTIGTGNQGRRLAGANPASLGGFDAFVAKYVDTGDHYANGWATVGGGTSDDLGLALAVRGTTIYTTGYFVSNTNVRIAGTALAGTGTREMYLAKYTDSGPAALDGGAVYGGGSGYDYGQGVAVSGANVYVTGYYSGPARFAGVIVPGIGSYDMFLAKYVDTGSSLDNGWVVAGGGAGSDSGESVAVNGNAVYVTGSAGPSATFAGSSSANTSTDVFVARYTDLGSSPRGNWALFGGGSSLDVGQAVAVRGATVCVAGSIVPTAIFGTTQLSLPTGGTEINFLATLVDPVPVLGTAASAGATLSLYPNPARGTCTVLLPAGAGTVQVLDALGRQVRRVAAAGGAVVLEVAGLPGGVYTVRVLGSAGAAVQRLVVE